MTWIIIYFMVGLIIAMATHSDDYDGFLWVFLWPILLLICLIAWILGIDE
jgi:hypothetical protein